MKRRREQRSSSWSWFGSGGRDFRGLHPASAGKAAGAVAISLVWGAAAIAGVRGLESGAEAVRWAGAAAVAIPPLGLTWFSRYRLARLDELQALMEARALMSGALWALSAGAALYAISALQGDPEPELLLAIMPPAGFAFGALMLIVEQQELSDGEAGR